MDSIVEGACMGRGRGTAESVIAYSELQIITGVAERSHGVKAMEGR